MSKKFFSEPTDINPRIYAYEDTNPQYKGLLKVGYTSVDVKKRVAQQYPTLRPGNLPYRILVDEPAMKNDGSILFVLVENHAPIPSIGLFESKLAQSLTLYRIPIRLTNNKATFSQIQTN